MGDDFFSRSFENLFDLLLHERWEKKVDDFCRCFKEVSLYDDKNKSKGKRPYKR